MDTITARATRSRASAFTPPAVRGFRPAAHRGGCGPKGRLRILCLHDKNRNALCMAKEVERMFLSDAPLISKVSVEYLDSPHTASQDEAPDFAAFGRLYGGSPRLWHRGENRLGELDEWPLLPESLKFVSDYLRKNGPFDGLCGFGQGADMLAVIAMLVEEGESSLHGLFKFLICVSPIWPKRPSWRPRAPLKVPTCHVYETNGFTSLSDFEHVILHWEPDCREVIVHHDGHEMPRLTGDGLRAFTAFLESFYLGEAWLPDEDWAGRLTLPMPQSIQKPPRTSPPRRRLVVACFHDAQRQGENSSPDVFKPLTQAILQDNELSCRVALDPPDLSRYVVLEDLHNIERPPCPRYEASHVVSPLNDRAADEVVRCFLKHNLRQTPVLVVGVGIGAYIGLKYALALKDTEGFPWALYAVKPPVVFPLQESGCLGSCDVTVVVSDEDTGGERWRFEAATLGRYQTEVFPAADGDAGWVDIVTRSLRARVPLLASPAF